MPPSATDETAIPSPKPAPRAWGDPWAWAAAAAVGLLLAKAWGAPLGEPFADDFHFLRHAMFGDAWRLLDGGGAVVYWRPVSRQAYFGLMGPLMLSHPLWLALVHAAVLAGAAVLIHRALRPHWPGPWAAAAASFPLIAESSRALLLWPSAFQDLGALAFSALALHQAARRRLPTSLAALAAALLCKEVAIVAGLLLPWMPGRWERGERRRWLMATAATIGAWGLAYAAVMNRAGILFQRHLEADRPGLAERFVWALRSSLADAAGVGALPGGLVVAIAGSFAALVAVAIAVAMTTAASRARLRATSPWIVWGLAWFLANTATLSEVFPVWGPFRSAFGMVGLGVAVAALVGAAGPPWLLALVALRIGALLSSPGPPVRISNMPYEEGVPLDFASLTRLSRLTEAARVTLQSEHPELPRGATVVWHHRPMMADHAFAHGKALQVWYRDTTLTWVTWSDLQARPERPVAAALEFEVYEPRQVVGIAPAAMVAYLRAVEAMEADDGPAALAGLERADSLQTDRDAKVFLATLAGKRALCRLAGGELATARDEAVESLELWPDGGDARYVMAVWLAVEGRLDEARAQVDSLLARYPFDPSGKALRDTLEFLRAR